jgi:hypothetical protein
MARNPRSFVEDNQTEGTEGVGTDIENTAVEGEGASAETSGETSGETSETEAPEVDLSKMTAAQRIAYLAAQNSGKGKAKKGKGKEGAEGEAKPAKPKIMLFDPENGQPIPRADLIKRLWTQEKLSRSEITTVLNDPKVNPPDLSTGVQKKIAYQIVFATTKGVVGGPDKPAESVTKAATSEGAEQLQAESSGEQQAAAE